jgi:hypothetical protein
MVVYRFTIAAIPGSISCRQSKRSVDRCRRQWIDAFLLEWPSPLRPRAFGGKGVEGMKKEIPAIIGRFEQPLHQSLLVQAPHRFDRFFGYSLSVPQVDDLQYRNWTD